MCASALGDLRFWRPFGQAFGGPSKNFGGHLEGLLRNS